MSYFTVNENFHILKALHSPINSFLNSIYQLKHWLELQRPIFLVYLLKFYKTFISTQKGNVSHRQSSICIMFDG